MSQSQPYVPDPEHHFDDIVLSPDVCIEFHTGERGVSWATLHVGKHNTVEVGSVRTTADVDSVLTMVAGILLERTAWADDVWVSEDRTERWVLIGSWLLNARLDQKPGHLQAGSPQIARELFDRRRHR